MPGDKNDVYVKMTVGANEKQTKPKTDAGEKATFNTLDLSDFQFRVTKDQVQKKNVKVVVMDKNTFAADKEIGAADVNIEKLLQSLNFLVVALDKIRVGSYHACTHTHSLTITAAFRFTVTLTLTLTLTLILNRQHMFRL